MAASVCRTSGQMGKGGIRAMMDILGDRDCLAWSGQISSLPEQARGCSKEMAISMSGESQVKFVTHRGCGRKEMKGVMER